jgi:hypothetical protein
LITPVLQDADKVILLFNLYDSRFIDGWSIFYWCQDLDHVEFKLVNCFVGVVGSILIIKKMERVGGEGPSKAASAPGV